MIVALDARYDDSLALGTAAAVVFAGWGDSHPVAEVTEVIANIQPYVPGEFYRRELPGLLAVLGKIREPLDVIVIDGYVCLNEKPALGQHLFERLGGRIPVIGVAKSRFAGAAAREVFRGKSKSPLFVTAAGIDPRDAAERIRAMHGPHRIPTLLKRVDQLARGIAEPDEARMTSRQRGRTKHE
jgi:deoxyribonuclease V